MGLFDVLFGSPDEPNDDDGKRDDGKRDYGSDNVGQNPTGRPRRSSAGKRRQHDRKNFGGTRWERNENE